MAIDLKSEAYLGNATEIIEIHPLFLALISSYN